MYRYRVAYHGGHNLNVLGNCALNLAKFAIRIQNARHFKLPDSPKLQELRSGDLEGHDVGK